MITQQANGGSVLKPAGFSFGLFKKHNSLEEQSPGGMKFKSIVVGSCVSAQRRPTQGEAMNHDLLSAALWRYIMLDLQCERTKRISP